MRALPVAVLASLLLAAAVRLPSLGRRSLASAEQAAFVESRGFSTTAAIPDGRPLDAAALARWTDLAGASETALRLPSALAGVLVAVLVALVAARLAGVRGAAWAGALVALSPIHSLASRQVGPEGPLVAVVALALLLLIRIEASPARREAIALGLLLGTLAANGTAAPAGFRSPGRRVAGRAARPERSHRGCPRPPWPEWCAARARRSRGWPGSSTTSPNRGRSR